ncbi:hypothetical protein [Spiroplasma endosymbiont of Seladonia tumulorum]|uniref:hypothetical protein n=1 Tax=Spiroplasma endosymbiont of Seladonia tumulorum TaxID=3066321 RepID=UPI0030CAC98D
MERVLYLGGAVVEPKGIIKHIVAKIDISKINKIDEQDIKVKNPQSVTQEELTPQFKNVVLKAVKQVDIVLTENDFNYFVESDEVDWPINLTDGETVFVQIEGKNKAIGQTKPIKVVLRPIAPNKKGANE